MSNCMCHCCEIEADEYCIKGHFLWTYWQSREAEAALSPTHRELAESAWKDYIQHINEESLLYYTGLSNVVTE